MISREEKRQNFLVQRKIIDLEQKVEQLEKENRELQSIIWGEKIVKSRSVSESSYKPVFLPAPPREFQNSRKNLRSQFIKKREEIDKLEEAERIEQNLKLKQRELSLGKLRSKSEIKSVILKKTNVISKAVVQIEHRRKNRSHLRAHSLEPFSLNIQSSLDEPPKAKAEVPEIQVNLEPP